jgi:hypothetical protein
MESDMELTLKWLGERLRQRAANPNLVYLGSTLFDHVDIELFRRVLHNNCPSPPLRCRSHQWIRHKTTIRNTANSSQPTMSILTTSPTVVLCIPSGGLPPPIVLQFQQMPTNMTLASLRNRASMCQAP